MSDDVQLAASRVVAPDPSDEIEVEVNAHQDAPAVAEEEQADGIAEDDISAGDLPLGNAELGEDEAGDSTASVPAPAWREAAVECVERRATARRGSCTNCLP